MVTSQGSAFDLNGFNEEIGSLGGSAGEVRLGGGTLTVGGNNASFTYIGAIAEAGNLKKRGTGDFYYRGNGTYTGSTIVEQGGLVIFEPIASQTYQINGGQLRLGADGVLPNSSSVHVAGEWRTNGFDQTVSAISGAGLIDLGAGALTVGNNSTPLSFSGEISGTGSFRKIGAQTLTLGGVSTHSGQTLVDAGKLIVNGSTGNSDIVLAQNATLGGNGTVGGSVTGAGRVAPGNSPGILTISGDYTQSTGSVLEIEVGGYTPGAGPMNDPNNGHDLLVVGGTATLGGRLEVPVIDPLKAAGGPTVGHPTIDFLTAGSVVGEFSTVVAPNLNSINPNLAVEVSYSPTGASLDFVPKKLNLEFNDATNDGTPTWREVFNPGMSDGSWRDKNSQLPAAEYPELKHDLTIENNAASAQTLQVVNPLEQVYRATIGTGDSPMNLVVGDGAGAAEVLNSVSSLDIMTNGTVCLDGGQIATATVNVSGGLLEGVGKIDLTGGGEPTPERLISVESGVVNPGMSSGGGSAVGALEFDGYYEQSAGAMLHIDVEGNAASGAFDKLTITGEATLAGVLEVNLASMPAITPGEVFTIATAQSVTGEFDDIQVVGSSDYYVSVDYGEGFTPGGSAPPEPGEEVPINLAAALMGSGDFDDDVDADDARVFAAV
ncbi:MAG: hypothetical protein KDA37_09995, partial [Planctomycetales bacterium]|nr:hypothetical protein [Planctomycetales bacterium]